MSGVRAILTFALLSAALQSAAGVDQPVKTFRHLGDPQPSTINSILADCVRVSAEMRVCKIVHDEQPFAGTCSIVLLVNSAVVASWESGSNMYRDMFDVRVGDLDGDASDELVIADHVATSNGMAVTEDNVIIVSAYSTAARSSLNFSVQEYCHECAEGTFVRRAGRPGVWIFATEWMRTAALDPRRGTGSYVVGRWLRYSHGKLIREPGVLVRRLLNGFDRERSESAPDTPYSWFVNGKGQSPAIDPAMGDGRVIQSIKGVVERVPQPDPGPSSYVIRLDTGQPTEFIFRNASSMNATEQRFDHVGLLATGRILPLGVSETNVLGDVIGHQTRIDTYRDGEGEQRVLWLR